MENKPKKSKALIITIIVIVLLLIAGYFLVKNRDMFGVKTSQSIAKIFAPLLPSTNTGDSKKITLAQAGEDIKSGDGVAVSGTDADGNPIVMKSDNKNYGVANQDIGYGEIGKISLNTGGSNNFLDSFSSFLNNIFNNGGGVTPPPTQVCSNNAINPPACDDFSTACLNGATNYPACNNITIGQCFNGATNPPVCDENITICMNGAVNPPVCNSTSNNTCINGATNYPACNDITECLNGATNPLLCNDNITICMNGAINPPACDDFGSGNNFPTVAVRASPSSVESGGSSTISWTSTNTTSCDTGDGNESSTNGSFNTGALLESKSYTVVCTGANGMTGGNVFVNVSGGLNIFPTVTVTASPSSVASGASSTISWTSTNTTSCDAGIGNGTGTAGSFETEALTFSKSYTVTCTGNIGSSTGNVFVSVNGIIASKPECSDEIDNDTDTLIDTLDPNCHLDGDILKDYVPTHDSESSSPESGFPDLKAGAVTPAKALINTITTLSSTIRNDGEGSTISEFSSFFTITKINPIDTQIDETGGAVSQSKFKNFFSKFSWFSIASAAINPGFNVINSSELVVTIPILLPKASSIAKVQYTFTTAGTYYIRACADKKNIGDFGLITESNELNNCGPWTNFTVTGSLPPPNALKQCSDSEDNDNDEKIDELDPNCHMDGDLQKAYVPEHDSEINSLTTLFQCNDLKDNDYDGKIDINDPNCHMDGDFNGIYKPTHNSESSSPTTPIVIEENKCLLIEQNPLTFTDAEKAKLAELLRKFYIIAPTLKTEDDINMVYREIDNYKSYVGRIDELINECYAETLSKDGTQKGKLEINGVMTLYTGPTTRFGNPWYKPETRGSYIDSTVSTTKSYCSDCGDGCDEHNIDLNCSERTTRFDCHVYDPEGKALVSGCKWIDATDIKEYEKILNIW